jgi:hypothetical protein
MSSPDSPEEDQSTSQISSSNFSWADSNAGDLSNKPTLAAAAASVRNTQANLDRIFGPAIEAILDSNDKVNHHEAETTVVSGHFPSSWIRPRPPTPHHSNAPPSPDIPQPPPSHHASRLFSLTGHQFTHPPCSSRTSQQPNIIPPEPNPTPHTPTSGTGFRPPLFADLFNMQHKPRADMEEA